MIRTVILIWVLAHAGYNVLAQNKAPFVIWTDFNASFNLSEQWSIGGDIGYRIEPVSTIQTAYIRPTVTYSPFKVASFVVGLANFNIFDSDGLSSTELRTFQFVVISWPRIISFQFKHRLGLEQRWFYLPEFGLDDHLNRARYYIEVVSPKFNLFNLRSPFYVLANFELLRDLENDIIGKLIDHNRYTVGLGNHITDRFKADIEYKLINFVDPVLNTLLSDFNVLRIRLYYNF